jgi:hypothetical protein
MVISLLKSWKVDFKMRFLLIISSTIFLVSCTAHFQQIDLTDKPQSKLDSQGKVLVATSQDGRYDTINYSGSGQMTSQVIVTAFARHAKHISITTSCSSIDSCLNDAKNNGQSYLVYPEILHWEERATEWSGKPDRIEVKITLLSVDNGEIIHSAIISGRSKWATLKWDHPQDLLPSPINTYVSSLY